MGNDEREGSELEEEQPHGDNQTQNQSHVGVVKEWGTITKDGKLPISFYFYTLLLFVGCFILFPQLNGIATSIVGRSSNQAPKYIMSQLTNPNNTTIPLDQNIPNTTLPIPNRTEHPLICTSSSNMTMIQTCPATNPPPQNQQMEAETETCPDYFRWIYEDLKPWRETGITWEAVEAGKEVAFFRLIILDGRVYVETYKKAFQTRDVFTIWGILQLIRVYPGKLPDLDLMFNCDDFPFIKKADYEAPNASVIPPMFHYCGDDHSFDIAFPDWSFWGWHEINIKPWEGVVKELKEGNERVKWVDRLPFAYWKGNIRMGRRLVLLRCNSTQHWNTQIYAQRWGLEVRRGFKQSNLADQCTHRYKIYMEGRAWSVSEKYIQACDSMLLLIQPRYYEFFTRSLVPLKHYWPIDQWKLCNSIKFAVDWGNNNTDKAQEIGKAGSKFITEELKMKNIYDYMFHLLSEYGKLLRYKPRIAQGAIEVCLETMACNAIGKEKQWKIDSMAKGPSQTGPCTMPPPYDPQHLENFLSMKYDISQNVGKWEASGDIGKVEFV